MAFMVPEYWYGTMYYCPDTEGDYYPADMFSKAWVAEQEECDEDDVAEETGWFVRLSAPGYSDATDWTGPFSKQREAREHILDTYEVHPDSGDEVQWDYVDEDVVERFLGPEDDEEGFGDLDIYTGDVDGTFGVSTLTINPVTGTPYVRMFSEERDAIAYARDRVAKGPPLYFPRRNVPEEMTRIRKGKKMVLPPAVRNPKAKVYYVGEMPKHQVDPDTGGRLFLPKYRVIRGAVRGVDSLLVFRNAGIVTLRGEETIRWVLDRRFTITGRVDEKQIRIREEHRKYRKKPWEG